MAKSWPPTLVFYVNLSNVSGATIADGQGLGTITNDDAKTRRASAATASSSQSLAVAATAETSQTVRATDQVFLELALTIQKNKDRKAIASTADPWSDLMLLQLPALDWQSGNVDRGNS